MFVVAALYKFTPLASLETVQGTLARIANKNGVKGTLLLASEGINGTIAGTRSGIDAVLSQIKDLPGCADLEWKESTASEMPFIRMKVRLKREIVTMGQPDVDPIHKVGTYVAPNDWNDLISREDVVVIDTRNDYEVDIGSFKDAVDPKTASFREFPGWWDRNKARFGNKKIAMYCTGGIRCEKASSFLLEQGADEVFHLKGGILKYLEEVPVENSLWQGDCFVFDNRVSVRHGLEEGDYDLCHACRRPISEADKIHADYEPGVSCARCKAEFSESDRERFRERQRQVKLARARGTRHIGDT
ncbi:MAG: rhodanese-related sulfurtransferase [Silicimonas sp.]|nr:rhodanese-related sulfurtransferase [Silicimonas sp.]